MRRVRAPGREDGRGGRREEATADEAAGLNESEFRPRARRREFDLKIGSACRLTFHASGERRSTPPTGPDAPSARLGARDRPRLRANRPRSRAAPSTSLRGVASSPGDLRALRTFRDGWCRPSRTRRGFSMLLDPEPWVGAASPPYRDAAGAAMRAMTASEFDARAESWRLRAVSGELDAEILRVAGVSPSRRERARPGSPLRRLLRPRHLPHRHGGAPPRARGRVDPGRPRRRRARPRARRRVRPVGRRRRRRLGGAASGGRRRRRACPRRRRRTRRPAHRPTHRARDRRRARRARDARARVRPRVPGLARIGRSNVVAASPASRLRRRARARVARRRLVGGGAARARRARGGDAKKLEGVNEEPTSPASAPASPAEATRPPPKTPPSVSFHSGRVVRSTPHSPSAAAAAAAAARTDARGRGVVRPAPSAPSAAASPAARKGSARRGFGRPAPAPAPASASAPDVGARASPARDALGRAPVAAAAAGLARRAA